MGKCIAVLCLFTLLSVALAGCGNNDTGPVSTLEASQSCIGCHASVVSSVTGVSIVEEWKLSTHNTKNGASCADCHEPDPGHPNNCGTCHNGTTPSGDGHDVLANPDQSQKCYKCHGLQHPTDVMMQKAPQHFSNMTTVNTIKYRASYVSSMYVGNCRKCHNPHDTSTNIPINRQWAASGHGDVTANARVAYDFKTRGTYEPVNLTFQNYCVRCHTTTGYINYVSSGFSSQQPFAGTGFAVVQNLYIPSTITPNVSPDRSKELTACNACHDNGQGSSYSFALRVVPPVRVYYNYSSPTKLGQTAKINNAPLFYPDAGPSNMCVVCHAGRGTGQLIKTAAAMFLNFSSVSAISAHDFTGAGTLFKKIGYEYDGRDYGNPPNFLHDQIGRNNFMNTGNQGPCITCHMNSDLSHSFLPVTFDNRSSGKISSIVSRTCSSCHNGSNALAWTIAGLQQRRNGFNAALAAFNALLVKDMLSPTTNWAAFRGKNNGPNTMGASFNYSQLKNDWGAYAHNDVYVKRLIYDSIDWLNDGAMNYDTEAAINGLAAAGKISATTRDAAIQYLQGTGDNPSGYNGSRP